ncbi:MAG: asparagine synthase-related protein, partial [Vulcanimicrobiaceae bacterium]
MDAELARKERTLREIVRGLGRVVVAFSGGVDSALVLHVATQELGDDAICITAHSASLPQHEETAAVATARASGAQHEVVVTHEVEDPQYAANPHNRCYFCKRELYGTLVEIAASRGARAVLDGFNLDDAGDWRPGRKAATEFGVRSPLAEACLGKDDVRALARHL